jgi:hypothetical protein
MRELGCFTYVEAKTASEINECDISNLKNMSGSSGFLAVS